MKSIFFAILLHFALPLYSLANPAITSVSFQLKKKFIIVQASVNGKRGHFIFDTGVSDIILNNKYFTGKLTGDKFYGIHGNEVEKEFALIRIDIEGFEKKAVATVTDFTALERLTGLELLGVVGNAIFKDCEVVLDYIFKEVTIYRLDKKGIPLFSKKLHQTAMDTLPFVTKKGVPLVEVNVNGERLTMIVDSGATANVMDRSEFNRLNTGSSPVLEVSLVGFGSEKVSVKSQSIDKLRVGLLTCPPMKTLIVDLDHLNLTQNGRRVEGVLGYEFLSNFRVAINFKKREIYLWDRESVELQWALANNNE